MSAAAWFEFFFTLPDYRSTIRSSADIITAVLLLVVGVAVSQLAARARRLQVTTITDAGYLAQIHQTASLTQAARSPDAVADHVGEQLIGLLDLEGCRFEYDSLLGRPPRLEPDGHRDRRSQRVGRKNRARPARRSSCGHSATASTTDGS